MKNYLRQFRAQSEGKYVFLPSLLVALFLLSACGMSGFDNNVIMQDAGAAEATGTTKTPVVTATAVATETAETCGENNHDSMEDGMKPALAIEETGHEKLVIHVCGAVEHPGVYELKQGSRVVDAVAVAGGFSSDACTDSMNLASLLQDAVRIYIPNMGEIEAGKCFETYEDSDAVAQEEKLININTANEERLMQITGIGATKAKNIIAYREEHGAFRKPEEITCVTGIGEATYKRIKDQITVN